MSSYTYKIVVNLHHPTPFFNIPIESVELMREKCTNSNIVIISNNRELLKEIEDADIYFTWRITREVYKAAINLKWFHSGAAGIGASLFSEIVKSPLIITNSRGIGASTIAEHVLFLMLALSRQMKIYFNYQLNHYWAKNELIAQYKIPQALEGKSLGIIGLGNIGKELARRAHCFGMKVIAVKKHITADKIEVVDKLFPEDCLPELLKASDFVVVCVPLTKNTWGLIGKKELRLMKPTAFLINVARGKIVNQKELINALQEGVIAGAALDVVEEEPLPKESTLWSMDNVIITPHIAGVFPNYWEKCVNLFIENYKRFIEKKELINVVNKKEGF
jgi:phosphoglycerate dehydrogenase-like enzyme